MIGLYINKMQFLLGVLVGMVLTLKLFPPSLVQNEIEQNIKKVKDSDGTIITQTPGEPKPKKFLGIFKRKKQ